MTVISSLITRRDEMPDGTVGYHEHTAADCVCRTWYRISTSKVIRKSSTRQRAWRAVDDELLSEVAAIARKRHHGWTLAVADEMGTSHRNATRWIRIAKDRGFLP